MNKNILLRKDTWIDLGFILLLVLVFVLANYPEILSLSPRGIHFIRQTDSLSFTDNYYLHNLGFFDSQVYNQTSEGGRASCEFPIIYYVSSKLYLVFGNQFWIQRALNLLIFSSGIFSFYKLSKRILNDWIFAYILPMLLLTSTIVLYYGINYLVDISAMGFVLIGLNLFHKSYHKNCNIWLQGSAYLFFLLAALLKPSFGIAPLAIFGVVFFYWFTAKGQISSGLRRWLIYSNLFLLITAFLTTTWFFYSKDYNLKYGDDYFLTTIVPYWHLNSDEKNTVFDLIINYRRRQYYYPQTVQLSLLGILSVFVFYKRVSLEIVSFLAIGLFGLLCYFLLFFGQFRDHDYYFLPFIPFFGVAFILIAQLFSSCSVWVVRTAKIVLLLLSIAGIRYGIIKEKRRYFEEKDYYEYPRFDLIHSDKIFYELGIPKDEKILVIGDKTKNGSLYFLKRKGLTFGDMKALEEAMIVEDISTEYPLLLVDDELHISQLPSGYNSIPLQRIGNWSLYQKIKE